MTTMLETSYAPSLRRRSSKATIRRNAHCAWSRAASRSNRRSPAEQSGCSTAGRWVINEWIILAVGGESVTVEADASRWRAAASPTARSARWARPDSLASGPWPSLRTASRSPSGRTR